jgi:hypothetical protein
VNAVVDYQIGGAYPPVAGVAVVDRDATAPAAPGRYGICYVNAFQTQPGNDATWLSDHADLLLRSADGRPVEDPDWPGELLLDTSSARTRTALLRIVEPVLDRCAAAGYRAVEADNLDSYTRSGGRLSPGDDEAYAALLIGQAHRRGLAIGQKNAADLAARGRRLGFDFAVAEECQVYAECDAYTDAYGGEVIEIEYTDNGRDAFPEACRLRGGTISVVLRDRGVVPRGDAAYRYRSC